MDRNTLKERLTGISVVPVTPFSEDASELDVDGIKTNLDFLLANGVEVVVPNGNTGEFYHLSLDEAKQALEVTVSHARQQGSDVTIVAGVGYGLPMALELARHAQETGADAIMIHHPVMPYVGAQGIKNYYDTICDAVDIGVVIYKKGANLSDQILVEMVKRDEVVGIKYAVNDNLLGLGAALAAGADQEATWVCGTAESWTPFMWQVGARGFTSGLANVAPDLSFGLLEALRAGNTEEVTRLWRLLRPFEAIRGEDGSGKNVTAVKAALDLIGLRGGPVRPTSTPLTREDQARVRAILQEWGKL